MPAKETTPELEAGLQSCECEPLVRQSSPLALTILATLYSALWLIGHGYVGLWHDARLYGFQALARSKPQAFSSDLFLEFGSQDQFSIYSSLISLLVPILGLPKVTFLVSTAGTLLWTCACVLLALRLLGSRSCFRLGMFFILALPGFYGALEIFAVGRPLATPRVFSEAFVILAMWVWSYRYGDARKCLRSVTLASIGAVLLLIIAGFTHPLMAFAGILIVALEWVWQAKKVWWGVGLAVVGAACVLVLALFSIEPFDRLMSTFDSTWLHVVEHRTPQLFLGNWLLRDWLRLTVLVGVALAASRFLAGWRLRFVVLSVVVAVVGLIANGIGGDLLNNVLLTQLQFFRLAWVLQLMAPLMGGVLVARAWSNWPKYGGPCALLGLSVVLAWVGVSREQFLVAFILLSVALWALLLDTPHFRLRSIWVVRVSCILSLVLVGLALSASIQGALRNVEVEGFRIGALVAYMLDMPRFALGAFLIPVLFYRVARKRLGYCLLLSVLLLAGTATVFDRRLQVTAAVEEGGVAEQIAGLVPIGRLTFWEHEVVFPWFLLERPSYFSRPQGAGVVFNRKTALEYRRRLLLLGPLAPLDDGLRDGAGEEEVLGPLDRAIRICEDREDLHLLVLRMPLKGKNSVLAWPPEETLDGSGRVVDVPGGFSYHAYLCRDLKRML